MKEEGITFKTKTEIGKDISAKELHNDFDAVILCTGATKPRDVEVEGRELQGIHFAMDFLTKNTRSLLNSDHNDGQYITAKDKHVIVIGGGDTGVDCITTSVRHGAASITQFDINREKTDQRAEGNPWPLFPIVHTVEDGQKEAIAVYGKDPRSYQVSTTKFVGDENGQVKELHTIGVETTIDENGRKVRTPIPGTEKVWKADLILLAIGFTGPEQRIIEELSVETTKRSTIDAEYGKYSTNVPGVFAAGDNRRGQSLVVWAIHEGREAARECDRFLMGSSNLP